MKGRKKSLFIAFVLVAVMLTSQFLVYADGAAKGRAAFPEDKGSFAFDGNYVAPELVIDGRADDAEWTGKEVLTTFGQSTNGGGNVSVKVHHGEKALFFFFNVTDKNLLTYGNSNNDDVNKSDSIEVYINTMESMDSSTGYQINLAIHGKTRILKQTNKMTSTWTAGWGGWNALIDYEVQLNGTLNNTADEDTGYTLELMVPYSQISIDKNSTIGIAFGRGDKWSTAGSTIKTHHDWFGWNYGGTVDPQMPTSYVCLKPDGTLVSQDSLPKPNAMIAGTITDKTEGTPLEGVVIKNGETTLATTGLDGYYVISGVNPEINLTLALSKDGYYGAEITVTRAELRAANGGTVIKDAEMLTADAPKSNIKGTVKNVINGVVSGATVSIKDTLITATTAADGTFTIDEAPVTGGATLIISKSGHADETIVMEESEFTLGDDTEIGDVNLSLAYKSNAGVLGGASGRDVWSIMATRTLTGIRFYMKTVTKFESGTNNNTSETVILYLHSGALPTANKAFSLQFRANGTFGYDKGANSNWTQPATTGIKYSVVGANLETGAEITADIPYSTFRLNNASFGVADVFGFSAGTNSYNSTGARGWDGFGFDGFIDPEIFANYIRVDRLNNMYKANSNDTQVTLSGKVTGTSDTNLGGATVTIDSTTATTNSQGSYNMNISKPSVAKTVTFKATGYEWGTETLSPSEFESAFSATINKQLTQRFNTVAGVVKDSENNPIEGVSITVTGNGTELGSATTNASGEYSVANVPAFYTLTVTAAKEPYSNGTASITISEQNAVAAGATLTATPISLSAEQVSLSGKVINVFGEEIEGATVTVVGQAVSPVTTAAGGTFAMSGVGLGDLTVTIAKAGYLTETLTIGKTSLTADANYDVGTVDIKLPYAEMGNFAGKNNNFSNFKGQITRGAGALVFYFTSEFDRFVTGDRIELFINTKATAANNARGNGDYLFNLNATGVVTVVDWGAAPKNETVVSGMTLSIVRDGGKTYVTFKLPYSFFGAKGAGFEVTPLEVIGLSIGQWSSAASDWDGWTYNYAGQTANNAPFVAPEWTADYIRLSKENILFSATTNNTPDFDAPIRFGTSAEGNTNSLNLADNFYARVSRDETGLIFNIHTYGNFGMNGANHEMVLIYLDIDGTSPTSGWTVGATDPLFKIRSDGKIFYRTGDVWWSTNTSTDLTLPDITITRENGLTSFTVVIPYSVLTGIDSEDTVGFAMREASHNSANYNLYDPWFDCFFNPNANATTASASRWAGFTLNGANGLDAAAQSQYVKIAADGALSK